MTKTIARLWNGDLEPAKHVGKNNAQAKELERLIQRNGERLEKYLDQKAKGVFEKYNDCISDYLYVMNEQAFCDGFCLGTKIMAEGMSGAEEIL